jgi:flagellar biosynthesis chaperone FliJ
MKTKFSAVVKVKKQAVDKLQRDIQKINVSILDLKNKIESLEKILISLTPPQNGNFSVFSQIRTQQNMLRDEIKKFENQIMVLENRKNELMNELKKANIEYEKMKYIEAQEIKKLIKQNKLKESRDMDELAILLRNNDGSK